MSLAGQLTQSGADVPDSTVGLNATHINACCQICETALLMGAKLGTRSSCLDLK